MLRQLGPANDAAAAEALRFIAAHHDAAERSCAAGHLTASCLILDPVAAEVLLVHHARFGQWVQPGGHIEPDDADILESVRREVAEETGLDLYERVGERSRLELDPLPLVTIFPGCGRPGSLHVDLSFIAWADSAALEPHPAARWFAVSQLLDDQAADEHVRRLIDHARSNRSERFT